MGARVPGMDQNAGDEPDRISALLDLWRGTGARISERRNYEWKIAFGVWAAQLGAMAELLSHNHPPTPGWLSGPYLGAGIAVAVLHLLYLFQFVGPQNKRDATIAVGYERAVLSELQLEIKIDGPYTGPGDWARLFEIGVTSLLAVIGPLAINRWC